MAPALDAQPWDSIRGEGDFDTFDKAELMAGASAVPPRLPAAIERHEGWLRRSSLVWFSNQFANGGLWQTVYNCRGWEFAMAWIASSMEFAGAPLAAAEWRRTIAIFERFTADEKAQFFRMPCGPLSMALDERLGEMSAILWGGWGGQPKKEDLLALAARLPRY